MGPTLYRFSGLKTYIERLYLAPDSEIDLEFATKRMAAVVDSAGLRRNAARMVRELAGGRFKGLRPITAERVWVRPPEGFGAVYRTIHSCLEELGVVVRCPTTLMGIGSENGRFTLETSDGAEAFHQLLSLSPARGLATEQFSKPGEQSHKFIRKGGRVLTSYTGPRSFTKDHHATSAM